MDITEFPATGVGANQKVIGDSFPMACISWDDITKEGGFLSKINLKLAELKNTNSTLASALGNKEFRLPSEWEWEYAAAGGKDRTSLKYYYPGTTGKSPEDLQQVAVNSLSPNKAVTPAVVGSKLPNALGLYDMAGNVWEWCDGLGYPGYETTDGYLLSDGTWNSVNRPRRGGSWSFDENASFIFYGRGNNTNDSRGDYCGFRLAL